MARDLARDGRGGPGPRQGALSWDDYFMSVAFLTAMRSKDPSTQVGACIVNDRNRIIGVGYNGMPGGCPNDQLPWSKRSPEGELATKYPYVVHAELNAVLNKNAESCSGCRIYSTLFPCNECAKVIIQAGIKQVIFASDKHNDRASAKASRRLFELANVQLRQHVPEAELLQLPLRYTEEARGSVAAADAPAPLAVAACDCSRHTQHSQHSQHWHATGHATGWHAGGHAVGAFAASASAALFAGVLARRRGTGMPGMPGLLRALRALRV